MDHGPAAVAPTAEPVDRPRRLYRASSGSYVAGVARGLAIHLGVDPLVTRIAFVALTFIGGAGILLYAAFWFFVPADDDPVSADRQVNQGWSAGRITALVALTIGAQLAVQWLGLGISGTVLWPLVLTAFGVAVLWRQADATQRARWWAVASDVSKPSTIARSVVGAVLVVAGLAVFLAYHGQLRAMRGGLLGTIVVVAGLALITGPWWLRTVRDLSDERRERIRSQERAEVAAHLHDSVLHTLTLIQRHVEDPREVARLARSQERELRTWLYRPNQRAEETFAAALEAVAGEVEDAHRVTIEVVAVGDCPLDPHLDALLQAAREAMVNAAKYAAGAPISVYAEVSEAAVEAFVRDRGPGYVPEEVPVDRHGVRESIIGRMERHGGTASVRTAPGEGTDVRLSMARGAA